MSETTIGRRRLRVGLLISNPEEEFDNAVCEGAMIAAKHFDVDMFILPGRYIDAQYADKIRTAYEYQFNTVFELAKDKCFDALLVLIGTIGSHLDKKRREEFLKKFSDIPIITLTSQINGYPCITVDNRTGLKQVIKHLIEAHSCFKIGFVSGPMTSDDAVERFEVYKEVLAEYGIEYDDNKVAYGNFSKHVQNEVGELLDRCPDLDAIVFSNDQMAIGGYKAMEKRGIRPGTDILVTGFDDDPAATDLTPHLTTVAMDSTELGYNALIEAVNYINDGTIQQEMVSSKIIIRNSCGCTDAASAELNALHNDPKMITEHADDICRTIFNRYRKSPTSIKYCKTFAKIIQELCSSAERIKQDNDFDPYHIFEQLEDTITDDFFEYTDLETLYSTMEYIHSALACTLDTKTEQLRLNSIFIRLYKLISERHIKMNNCKLKNNTLMTKLTNMTARDMLVFDAYDDTAYCSVVDKMSRLNVTASYLYVYDNVVEHHKGMEWKFPDCIKLKAYHNMSKPKLLPPEEQHIAPEELLTNKHFVHDRRCTMICLPLFTNEEHYGLLICELEHQDFSFLSSLMVQICAALKMIVVMKNQKIIEKQLNQSLIEIRENNQLLDELSKQDDLTGCLNRRGFFESARKLIRAEENEGCSAVMIFADLDSLKTINDRFGHEEGDFAIRGVAKILSSAFRCGEVIGRLGGDEFVVCVKTDENFSAAAIRKRIDEISAEFNENEGRNKEFYVHASVGVYPFKCTSDDEIGELLSHADALLYSQKKNKLSVIKSERTKQIRE
ncbi:substrate-binding and GGDEF domain-containing protein [Ruminococcus albus]|uniref:Diguanylate cyclase (GGDEF) domain-containing protein n=1 Tax=Ruminococcus albus TaxID=1264 RepID=A0A1I1GTE2_RUMAL|nr:GGDEF domain-containing protein [Ruminococcus albus]SFC15079.1 diguanylate cyclase (GGDEF) domain-containing protein [Ruminococcus albus]